MKVGVYMLNRGQRTYIKELLQSYPKIKKLSVRTRKEQRLVDGIENALHDIEHMKDGKEILLFIKRVYFDQSHKVYGAALLVPVSRSTAIRWNKTVYETVSSVFNLV